MSGAEGWWIDFVAGWVSGATSVLACQPLDTVLTRFQAGQAVAATTTSAATATSGVNTVAQVNLASSVKGLAREHGITSLWRGSSPMIGIVPFQNALLMGGYGIGKQYSSSNGGLVPVFVGGCAGGVLQSFLVSPVEWIKIHQQTGLGTATTKSGTTSTTTSSTTTTNLARTLQKSGLWNRGLMATLLRDGIPHGVWFASYEYCKVKMVRASKSTDDEPDVYYYYYYESAIVPLVSGAFAATTAWAVGYPFDIIKTRIQANNKAQGVMETAKQLVAEAEGNVLRGLYRGFGLKLARSIPASMIGFLTYEVVSKGLTRD